MAEDDSNLLLLYGRQQKAELASQLYCNANGDNGDTDDQMVMIQMVRWL